MTEEDFTNIAILVLGLTEYHKDIISVYVSNGIEYLRNSGVKDDVIYSRKSIGAIVQYVSDTYTYNPGIVKFSPALEANVIQLTLCGDEDV